MTPRDNKRLDLYAMQILEHFDAQIKQMGLRGATCEEIQAAREEMRDKIIRRLGARLKNPTKRQVNLMDALKRSLADS